MADYYDNSGLGQRFQPGTTVRADEVDAKLDMVASGFVEVADDVRRALKLPKGTTVDQVINQNELQRRNATLGFDQDGNLTILTGLRWDGSWVPGKEYVPGTMVAAPNLNLYVAHTAHTSGPSFDPSQWDLAVDIYLIEQHKIAAENAKDESEYARDASQAARDASQAAQGLSEDARDLSEQYRDSANSHMADAEDAKNEAEKWAENPVESAVEPGKYSALHHSEKASQARTGSEQAQTASEQARDQSQTAQQASEDARDDAIQIKADTAAEKLLAESARDDAQTAKGEAETAQQASEDARDDSEQYRDQSRTARNESEAALDSFLKMYLGPYSSAPTTDNDGDPLQVGALYLSTATGDEGMRHWSGSGWDRAYATIDGVSWTDVSGKPSFAAVATSGAYVDLSDKPLTFPPEGHTHPWNEVTSKPATATRWPAWGEVTGKPATFAPSSHDHSAGEISDLSDAATTTVATIRSGTSKADVGLGSVDNYSRAHYDGRYLGKTAKAVDSDKLDGQHASAFAAASHWHAIGDVSGLQSALDGKRAQTDTAFRRYDLASGTTTGALNLVQQQVFRVAATSNCTLSFHNAPGSNRAMTVVVRLTGSAGTITWPSGISWSGGTAPELMGTWTAVTLFWDGNTWSGFVSGGED